MTVFAVIGIVAVTLVFAYAFLFFFSFGACAWGGFDEFNPVVGTICWAVAAGIATGWWFLIGTHIDLSLSIA